MTTLHPFDALRPEYTLLWSRMVITNPAAVDKVAHKLLELRGRYAPVTEKTGVPLAWLMPVDERESGADGTKYFGNGDPLDKPTTDVPAGRGPFGDWTSGCIDAIQLDHVADGGPWSLELALYKSEAWNGYGPRAHGINTGYLWAGTNLYSKGKYVRDGKWDPNFVDEQIGVAPLMMRLMVLDPSLTLPIWTLDQAHAADASMGSPPTPLLPMVYSAAKIQERLNELGQTPSLVVDGSFGRKTRLALKDFQSKHGLVVDGLPGPKTFAALDAAHAHEGGQT